MSSATLQRITILRHGRTDWNVLNMFQGQSNGASLDSKGIQQARNAAEQLRSGKPVRLFSSDLYRARQTADVLATAWNVSPLTDPRLSEINMGDWQGRSRQEVAEHWATELRHWLAGEDALGINAELRVDAGIRFAKAVHDAMLVAVNDSSDVVIVSHGIVIQEGLRVMQSKKVLDMEGDPVHLGNGEWMTFTVTPDLQLSYESCGFSELGGPAGLI